MLLPRHSGAKTEVVNSSTPQLHISSPHTPKFYPNGEKLTAQPNYPRSFRSCGSILNH
jgi:hypothetical protein